MLNRILARYKKNPLKFIAYVWVFACIIVIAGIVLYRLFFLSTVTITTNLDNSTILIKDRAGETITEKKTKTLRTELENGSYTVTVFIGNGSSISTQKNIEIRSFKKNGFIINTTPPSTIEPVLSNQGEFLSITDSSLFFTDPNSNFLMKVTSNGDVKSVSRFGFTNIKWIKGGVGVGLGSDNAIYYINNENITKLDLPKENFHNVFFDVNTTGSLYVALDKDVYKYDGLPASNHHKIYAAKKPIVSLNKTLTSLVISSSGSGLKENIEEGDSSLIGDLEVIKEERVIKSFKNINITQGVFSQPNTDYLIIANTIYNASDLKKIRTLPSDINSSFYWVDKTKLVYGINNTLYLYDKEDDSSHQLARDVPGKILSNLSSYKDELYFTSYTENGDQTTSYIGRLDIKNIKRIPDFIQGLSAYFPSYPEGCKIFYSNFQARVLRIAPGGNSIDFCIHTVIQELDADKIPRNEFDIQFINEEESYTT